MSQVNTASENQNKVLTSGEKELELYRSLMEAPKSFENGFTVKTIIGALFCGLIMLPGSIYLGLLAGTSIGPAATWVTLILFAEIARRSLQNLKKQEMIILLNAAGAVAGAAEAGFGSFIWRQYLVSSDAAQLTGLTPLFPSWFVPRPDSPAILDRTFFHRDWMIPIVVMSIGYIFNVISHFSLGYFFFRLTSDVERLPYPFAPVHASGALALAEASSKQHTWRWSAFSLGGVLGLVFGLVHVGIPTITGAVFGKPVVLIPIPWLDTSTLTENWLPAAATGLVIDLGIVLIGTVVPFWAVIGTFTAIILTLIANPFLYEFGVLQKWKTGMDTVTTTFVNGVDFWISAGIGISLAAALIGLGQAIRSIFRKRDEQRAKESAQGAASTEPASRKTWDPPPGRGDWSLKWVIGSYLISTIGSVILCRWLIPDFPLLFVAFFGFIYTPIMSYVSTRLLAVAGQHVEIPFIREASFILSGYRGIGIWFAPIPMGVEHGNTAENFRKAELTGTHFSSLLKLELLKFPIIMLFTFLYWSIIWKLSVIPSALYPYVQTMWKLRALNQCLLMSSTTGEGGSAVFFEAIHPQVILYCFIFATVAFIAMRAFGVPLLFAWGFIRGLGQMPHTMMLEIVGALVGRHVLQKKFGDRRWLEIAPVLLAGYSCGVGLIGAFCAAVALITKSVAKTLF